MDYFIKNNQDVIDSIYFQDLGNEMQKAVARRNQLNNISFNSKSNKRRKVHSKEKNRWN